MRVLDKLILPSILSADLMQLGKEVESVIAAGADYIHFDVMDNHYVPNLTFGPMLCANINKRYPNILLDVHLMTNQVDSLIEQFAKCGVSRISIHPDATIHLDRSLACIKSHNIQAGLALNPATPIDHVEWVQHKLDFILVMTVNPGFGGQKLIPEMYQKIIKLKERFPETPICVDGGVSIENIAELYKAGATQFVAGSAIFNSKDYKKTINEFREQLK